MNREIKFKFWLGHTEKMTYDHDLREVSKIIKEFTPDIIPLQYTGLKDKNEKEVFEGDIVIAWSQGVKRTVQVKWRQEGLPGWILYPAYYDGGFWKLHGSRHEKGHWYDDVEVIGNIYENKNLLQ